MLVPQQIAQFLAAATLTINLSASLAASIPRDPQNVEYRNTAITREDLLHRRSMDREAWRSKMIAEGKMYRPNLTEPIIIKRNAPVALNPREDSETWDVTYTLTNPTCAILLGNPDSRSQAETNFCAAIAQVSDAMVRTYSYGFQRLLCDGNLECERTIYLGFAGIGFVQSAVWGKICVDVWNEVNSVCGVAGGDFDVHVHAVNRVLPDIYRDGDGTVGSVFVAQDDGDVCPANPPREDQCKREDAF